MRKRTISPTASENKKNSCFLARTKGGFTGKSADDRHKSPTELLNNKFPIKLTPLIGKEFLKYFSRTPTQLPDIIIFSLNDWEDQSQRVHHFAFHLAALGHRVFFISRHLCQGPNLEINQVEKNIFGVRLPKKEKALLDPSAASKNKLIDPKFSIFRLIGTFYVNSAILMVDSPFLTNLAIHLKNTYGWKLIYDSAGYQGRISNRVAHVHQKEDVLLLDQSDLVLVASKTILDEVKKDNQNSIMVPDGVDYDLFHTAAQKHQVDILSNYGHPIIGFYGDISDLFDIELIERLSSAHPDWEFVHIGSTGPVDLQQVIERPNVHLIGEKPYHQLPEYISNFDVCILPFVQNNLTEATNPGILYECLSAGKPVIATKLNEISNYQDYVRLVETQAEWEAAIQESIQEETNDVLMRRRFDFAKSNTWQNRVTAIESAINRLFPKISIIIVTFNCIEYTKKCLESIKKNTEYPNYEIVVVDNASTDGTIEFLEKNSHSRRDMILIKNHRNLGFAAANNLGVMAASGDYVVLLNNDTIVTPGWLHHLHRHLTLNASAGMVGPVTNSIGNEAKIDVEYSGLEDINYFAARRNEIYSGKSFKIKVLALYCGIISRELYLRLGGLDEQFQIGMFEDDDFAMKMEQVGLDLLCAEDVFIHHFHGVSFKQLSELENHRIFFENKRKFEEKWGIKWHIHQYRRPKNRSWWPPLHR